MAASKFCIFCGQPPSDKNKEHVLPQWLIKLTGDPKRTARFGFISQPGQPSTPREYSFDRFTFPACEACNTKHSFLENQAKSVVEKLLNRRAVDSGELSSLLDWFDKVRVGLWLGFQQLSKNSLDVEPNFHIEKRIGQFDRMVIVERYAPAEKRLSMGGVDTPAFGITPSAFTLTINDLLFTNISFSCLVARRLGFPYPSDSQLSRDREGFMHQFEKGRRRVMRPVLQRSIRERGVILYQPMFANGLVDGEVSEYDDPYVRAHSLDYDKGIGSVFIESRGSARCVKPGETVLIDPLPLYSAHEIHVRSVINTCDWQDWIIERPFGFGDLTSEQRHYVRRKISMTKRVNKILREHHQRLLRSFGYEK